MHLKGEEGKLETKKIFTSLETPGISAYTCTNSATSALFERLMTHYPGSASDISTLFAKDVGHTVHKNNLSHIPTQKAVAYH